MPGPRISPEQLATILAKPGYGIKSQIGKAGIVTQIGGPRSVNDLESDPGDESLGAEKLQIGYSGKPEIRITFYRRRLADHSRAISEKALVDCLQYAGLIEGDSEEEIRLTHVVQKKVGTDEEERTELELFYEDVDLDNLWVPAKQNNSR